MDIYIYGYIYIYIYINSNGDLDRHIKAHLRAIFDLPEPFLTPRTPLKDAESRYASNRQSFSSIALTAVHFAKTFIFGTDFWKPDLGKKYRIPGPVL